MTQGKPGSARGGAQVRRMRRTQAHAATTARMDSPSRPGDFFAAPDEDDSELPIPDENASGCAPSDALYRVWPLVPETDSELPIPDENASGCAPSDALYRVWPLVPETDSELPIPDENASGCAPSDALYRVW